MGSFRYSVRDATPADYPVFARLFPELHVPDPLLTAAQFEERMLPSTVIAEGADRPLGYSHFRFYGGTAHVVHVVVDPEARGRGVGKVLMDAVRARVVAAGSTRWYLNVKKDNAPAIRLYESAGLAVEETGWSMRADWSVLLALPGAADTSQFEPTPDEMTALCGELDVDRERLAVVRARPGNVFVALRDASGPCAFAVFDPAFPGVYPLGAARPEHARPLFDALHPHARAPHLNIFVEGGEALANALLGGGATLTFEILRMGGALSGP
jgi:ribosomal-protein-alanine N-acetyltransferase